MFHFRLLYVAVCFLMQSTKFPFQLTYIGKCFYYSKRRIHSLLAFQYSSQHIQSSLREYGGKTRLLDDIFAVGFFDRKNIISSRVNRNI